MAMIQITCPSCGLAQEIDDSRGFGFCTECGTKIELDSSTQTAAQAAAQPPADVADVAADTGDDETILSALTSALKTDGNFVTNLSGIDECNSQFDRWLALIASFKEQIPALKSDLSKESAINQILAFCDRIGKTKISYTLGEAGKDGKEVIKTYSPDKVRASAVKDSRNYFISMFNSLPTRVELSKQLTEGLDLANDRLSRLKVSLKETREKFKASEKAFWNENPDVTNRKRDVRLSSLRILIIGAILAIVAFVYGCLGKKYLFLAVAALLLVSAVLISRKHTSKGVRKIKLEFFPDSLKQLESLLESYEKEYAQAEIDQKNAQEKLAAFEASRK